MAVKLDRKNFMITDKKNETLMKKKGDINGLNFKIRDLENCTVEKRWLIECEIRPKIYKESK